MNTEALSLAAVSILGLLAWRHWLAAHGAIRRWATLALVAIVGAAGACAVASAYLLRTATAAADTPERLAARVAQATAASAITMVCLAAGATLLAALTFVHRYREARG